MTGQLCAVKGTYTSMRQSFSFALFSTNVKLKLNLFRGSLLFSTETHNSEVLRCRLQVYIQVAGWSYPMKLMGQTYSTGRQTSANLYLVVAAVVVAPCCCLTRQSLHKKPINNPSLFPIYYSGYRYDLVITSFLGECSGTVLFGF